MHLRPALLALLLAPTLHACTAAPTIPAAPATEWRATQSPAPATEWRGTQNPAREAIGATLAHMNQAVLAGDPDAYLQHICPADPVFHQEQVNWAADLERHVPQTFSLTIEDPEVTPDGATARLTMTWRMEGGRRRNVSWTARFVPAPDQADADDPHTRWLYAGEKWSVFEGDRVQVFHTDPLARTAEAVAALTPEVRGHVVRGFGIADEMAGHVQQVKLYTSMAHLQASIYLSYTDPLAGWNEPGESIKTLARPGQGRAQLAPLLAHEFGHVCTFVMGEHATDMPWWILEGVAELAAEHFSGMRARTHSLARRWARNGQLADWDDLSDFRDFDPALSYHVYRQGHHMLGYISERFGRETRNAWLRAMAQGAALDEASRQTLGLSFADLDAQWRDALTNR